MRLAVAGGALLLAVAASAMPRTSSVYRGYGTEPFWDFRIGNGRMVYLVDGLPSVSVPVPRPSAIRQGRRYTTARMIVEITDEGRCNDGMSSRYWSDTLRIWFGRRAGNHLEGCGGVRVSPESLEGTGWTIVAIDGRAVSGDAYFLDFEDGRLTGKAGCNQFSGPYSEVRPNLRPGPIVSTRMACPGARMEDEQRALRILSGTLSMAFPRGDILLLAGPGGTMRLTSQD
jgi:heat shock protein HslJ